MNALVIGVTGASGGVGTSTVTGAIARWSALGGPSVAVDLDTGHGGLDATMCLEGISGMRWADVALWSGEVDGQRLLANLPSDDGFAALALDGRASFPSRDLVHETVTALTSVCEVVALDLGLAAKTGFLDWCDLVVLVSGTHPTGVLDALAVAPAIHAESAMWILAARYRRRERSRGSALMTTVRAPRMVFLPDDIAVLRDADLGEPPGSSSTSLSTAVKQIMRHRGPALARATSMNCELARDRQPNEPGPA